MSRNHTHWYRLALIVVISILVASCTDLAGDVEIVSTVAPVQSTIELPLTSPDIANGAQLFQQNCTSCHGVTGAGDGELVESGEVPRMGSFLDPIHMRQQSPEFYYDIITNGNIINLMPPWSGSLSVQERWDVAMYAYTLQYTPEQVARGDELVDNPSSELVLVGDNDLLATSAFEGDDAFATIASQRVASVLNWGVSPDDVPVQAEQTLEIATFSGQITQGSPNTALPTNISLQLQYGDFLDTTEIVDGTIDANGQFSFNDIPVSPNFTYFAVVFYNGRSFISEQLKTEDLSADNTVDITLYETSSAPNIVNQTYLDLVLDYLIVPDLGSGIVVNHLGVYDNPTDYIFHLEPEGQNIRVSLLVTLPVGSIFLDASEQSPFIQVADQFSLIDTRPVYPGEHFVETSYFIGYEGVAQTIDLVMNNRFLGDVSITMIDPDLRITGSGFEVSEELNLGTEDNPIPATVYSASVDLQPGESLVFDIEGRVSSNTSDSNSIITQDQLLPILFGFIIAVIILGGGLTWFLRRGSNTQHEIDRVITEINRLEKLHDAGQINHDVFQDKRSKLKEQLASLMAESSAE